MTVTEDYDDEAPLLGPPPRKGWHGRLIVGVFLVVSVYLAIGGSSDRSGGLERSSSLSTGAGSSEHLVFEFRREADLLRDESTDFWLTLVLQVLAVALTAALGVQQV